MIYLCDNKRHLICSPYSISNLHKMAKKLNIKKCWFHKNHYDIPKKRIIEIQDKCIVINKQTIYLIIHNYDKSKKKTDSSNFKYPNDFDASEVDIY